MKGRAIDAPQSKPTNNRRTDRILRFFLSHDPGLSAKPLDAVTAVAVAYLAIPNVIFLAGWLKLPFAVAIIALLAWSFREALRSRPLLWRWEYDAAASIAILTFATVWSAFGGAGHLMYANPDWYVRDAVLADLTRASWPVSYGVVEDRHVILRTAFGYFLPAALAGKILGAGALDTALFLWTALGMALFLFLLPLPRRAGWPLLGILLIVALFSGMDIIGFLIVQEGELPLFPGRLEWYMDLSYSSLSAHLLWAPNHAIAILIGTTLFFRHWQNPDFLKLSIIIFALLALWTPFAPVALAPFYVLLLLRHTGAGHFARRSIVEVVGSTLGPILLGAIVLRLLTLQANIPVTSPAFQSAGSEVASYSFRHYALFVLVEFGILAIFVGRLLKHSFGLFWLACSILALLPLLKFGPSNDLLLRGSLPSLTIMLILTISVLARDPAPKPSAKWIVPTILALGVPTPLAELGRSLTYPKWRADYSVSLPQTQPGGKLPLHYVGRLDRPDLIAVLRNPAMVPPGHKEGR